MNALNFVTSPVGESRRRGDGGGREDRVCRQQRRYVGSIRMASAGLSVRAVEEPVPSAGWISEVVNAMLRVGPVFEAAKKSAKEKMMSRGKDIGVDWGTSVAELEKLDLEETRQRLEDVTLDYPSYYRQQFHAYDSGNLSWDAGMEALAASVTVHSTVMTGMDNPQPDGDHIFRGNSLAFIAKSIASAGPTPRDIIDVGCSVGISTRMLKDTFPQARVTGVDPSVYMLSVASAYWSNERGYDIDWKHQFGEKLHDTPDEAVDLVTVMLVCHELPRHATGAVLDEAHRVLRPGGHLAIMELDPTSPASQKLISNPFFRGLFRTTEPWLDDYLTLDFERAISEAGFDDLRVSRTSPRHRTIVATKSDIAVKR